MMGQGVAKDIVIRVHLEQNLPLPLHHKQNYLDRQAERQGLATAPLPVQSAPVSGQTSTSHSSQQVDRERSASGLRLGAILPMPVAQQFTRHRSTSSESSVPSSSLPSNLPSRAVWTRSVASADHPARTDLSEKEAKAREQLLARKAAILAAKKAHADFGHPAAIAMGLPIPSRRSGSGLLEADVPRLTTGGVISAETVSGEDSAMSALKSEVCTPHDTATPITNGHSIAETREKLLDLGEQVSDEAVRQPFGADAGTVPLTVSPTSSAPETLTFRETAQVSVPKQRPVASDFLNEPAQASSVPRWSAKLVPTPNVKGMIIDLSDEEEDDSDTEELRHTVEEARLQQDATGPVSHRINQLRLQPAPKYVRSRSMDFQDGSGSRNRDAKSPQPQSSPPARSSPPLADPSPTSAVLPITNGTQLGDEAATVKLEAKQAEIKRMMEMISRLESKKKSKGTSSQIGTPTTSAAASPMPQHALLPPLAPIVQLAGSETDAPINTGHGAVPTASANETAAAHVVQLKDAKARLEVETQEMMSCNKATIDSLSALAGPSAETADDISMQESADESESMLVIRRDSSSAEEDLPALHRSGSGARQSSKEIKQVLEGDFTPPSTQDLEQNVKNDGTSAFCRNRPYASRGLT